MIIQRFFEWLNSLGEPIKDFIIEHGSNPIFWLGMFLAGVLVFSIVYGALHKNG